MTGGSLELLGIFRNVIDGQKKSLEKPQKQLHFFRPFGRLA